MNQATKTHPLRVPLTISLPVPQQQCRPSNSDREIRYRELRVVCVLVPSYGKTQVAIIEHQGPLIIPRKHWFQFSQGIKQGIGGYCPGMIADFNSTVLLQVDGFLEGANVR